MLTLPGPAGQGLERIYSPLLYRFIRSKGGGGYHKILKKFTLASKVLNIKHNACFYPLPHGRGLEIGVLTLGPKLGFVLTKGAAG